ncbi:hypothetical protein DKX38_018514 [Salix brachista]|uniref:Transcription termination and cleavage factor C-terminal domain-containing protein n=1 Tax=Salix brachista TaxID=2182728 RepID=A0A5N5KN72_9ROSI|nr:hypothetical protein DKX38_018514 [Salix brachista]
MTGKPIAGEGLPANLAGMTKNQLYDIMFQMKAQIMLGMVQPPQVVPNIQPAASQQQPQQSAQPSRQSNIQAAQTLPGQDAVQDKTSISQSQPPMKKQHQSQPAMSISAPPVPPVNLQSQPLPSHPLHMPQQPKGHLNPQVTSMSVTQSSQLPNLPPASSHSVSQPLPIHQTQMSSVSSQLQLPLQTPEIPHLPLQPPFPPQSRTPSVQSFHHPYGQQMGPNMGYQHAGAPHHPSQPMFHSSNKPHSSMGPSYPQGQPPHPNHQPPQSYQAGGSHLGGEYNSQIATSMQVDRGSSWMSGPPNSSMTQLAGPPQFNPGQMAQGNQSSRTAPVLSLNSFSLKVGVFCIVFFRVSTLTVNFGSALVVVKMSSEMEKALLQQVMSLTPEQINLLPPEQRNQVLQLQQMLRQ